MNEEKRKYIEENLFNYWAPTGTAKENWDGICTEFSEQDLVTKSGLKITLQDLEDYFEEIKA